MEDGVKSTKKMTVTILSFPIPTNILVRINKLGHVRILAGQSNGFLPRIVVYKRPTILLGRNTKQALRGVETKYCTENRRRCHNVWEKHVYQRILARLTFQKHIWCPTESGSSCGENHWKVILAGSRFTKGAESRYSPVEGEVLALVYGLMSCRIFILGFPDLIITADPQSLKKIFSDQVLENIYFLSLRSLMYRFCIKHMVPGKLNSAPDCTWLHLFARTHRENDY